MANETTTSIEFTLHLRRRSSEATLPVPSGRLPRITQVMALAISFQQMLESGEAKSYKAIARTTSITAERFSQVMKLLWLAPDIQQELLELDASSGRHPVTEHALRLIARHLLWEDQRREWIELKASLSLD